RRFRRSPPRVRVRSALGPAGTGSSCRLQQSASSFGFLRSQCLVYGQKSAVNPCEKLLRAFERTGLRGPLRVAEHGRQPLGAQVRVVRPPNSCTGAPLVAGRNIAHPLQATQERLLPRGGQERVLTVPPSGGWKAARTRTL